MYSFNTLEKIETIRKLKDNLDDVRDKGNFIVRFLTSKQPSFLKEFHQYVVTDRRHLFSFEDHREMATLDKFREKLLRPLQFLTDRSGNIEGFEDENYAVYSNYRKLTEDEIESLDYNIRRLKKGIDSLKDNFKLLMDFLKQSHANLLEELEDNMIMKFYHPNLFCPTFGQTADERLQLVKQVFQPLPRTI